MYCITADNIYDVCTEPWFHNSFWENMYAGNVDIDQDDFDLIVAEISECNREDRPTYKFKLLQLAVYLGLDVDTHTALLLTEREFCSSDERCRYIIRLFTHVIPVNMKSITCLQGSVPYRGGYIEDILSTNLEKFSAKQVLALGTMFNMYPALYEPLLTKKCVIISARLLAKLFIQNSITAEYAFLTVSRMTKKQRQVFCKTVLVSDALTSVKTIASMMCLKNVNQKNILYATYEYPRLMWTLATMYKAEISLRSLLFISSALEVDIKTMLQEYSLTKSVLHAEYIDLRRVDSDVIELVVSMCPIHVQEQVNKYVARCTDKCGICLETLVPHDLFILKCAHCYHYECIESWKKVHPSCPMCRTHC